MTVLTWVFAERQVVPGNYEHPVIDERNLRNDAFQFGGTNYLQLVDMTVDLFDGRAFITEYAQTTTHFLIDKQPADPPGGQPGAPLWVRDAAVRANVTGRDDHRPDIRGGDRPVGRIERPRSEPHESARILGLHEQADPHQLAELVREQPTHARAEELKSDVHEDQRQQENGCRQTRVVGTVKQPPTSEPFNTPRVGTPCASPHAQRSNSVDRALSAEDGLWIQWVDGPRQVTPG